VPVICTANDAYAPCLRPLRDIAAVYHFKPPAADKLASRIGAIAAAEGLSLDKQVRATSTVCVWGGDKGP
jgi:chromosome transmission fidelity protein 18